MGKVTKKDTRIEVRPIASGGKFSALNYDSNDWRKVTGERLEKPFQGVQVFAVSDPYSLKLRKEFRSAMSNAYIYRASRIETSFVAGQGWTTKAVPRNEEELPSEQQENWSQTTSFKLPYFKNKEFTAESIKDWVDKKATELKLSWNLFNAYFNCVEQGRGVLAFTPLAKTEDGKWQIPQQIRLIRTEFLMRPVLDNNTGELRGVYVVGVENSNRENIIPAERMMYVMHGFNNELFSDYFGDAGVARAADDGNTLNIILKKDYQMASRNTWHKPRAWFIPIPASEAGNEQKIVDAFSKKVNESEGLDIAVTGPSNKEENPPQILNSPNTADIGGLDVMRTGLIKSIVTSFGTPAFMLSEGDIGGLGGNSWLQEIDVFLSTVIAPEKTNLETVVENQFYDRLLCILFDIEDPTKLPMKITHRFNRPDLTTLIDPNMYAQLKDMVANGLIDESGLRQKLGLEELDKQTMSEGSDTNPNMEPVQDKWSPRLNSPLQLNVWPDSQGNVQVSANPWGSLSSNGGVTQTKWGKKQ